MIFKKLLSLVIIVGLKVLSRTFYRVESHWISSPKEDPWRDVKLIVFLNHTSLYEPLFVGAIPWRMLYRLAFKLVVPAADITIKRPIVGRFFKFLSPGMISITRKRDETWDNFMDHVDKDSLIVILPEGRMKRATGLDKHGKPMTVRGGVYDIIEKLKTGKMILAYSGGLHHVQIPGQTIPKIFKKIQINLEHLTIESFLEEVSKRSEDNLKNKLIAEFQERMKIHTPDDK